MPIFDVMEESVRDENEMPQMKKFSTGFVTSDDGTRIGYRQVGTGRGLILVHGAMMSSQNFMKLALELSGDYTVYISDRRGRGLSGGYGKDYTLMSETEDLRSLIYSTGAAYLFGLSSGAVIALQTALLEPLIMKVALYEPPIPVEGTEPASWLPVYEQSMSEGNLGKALFNIITKIGDRSLLIRLPGFLLIPLMNHAIKANARVAKKGEVTMEMLLPTMRYDAKIVTESKGIQEKCRNMKQDVLLLGGRKSQNMLKLALDALSAVLPEAKRIEFPGVGHTAADNSGKPELVARELKYFFNEGQSL